MWFLLCFVVAVLHATCCVWHSLRGVAGVADSVFVPAGSALSWRPHDDHSTVLVMQHCFVDASNLNDARRALMVWWWLT